MAARAKTGPADGRDVGLSSFFGLAAVALGLPPFTTAPKSAPGSGAQAELFGVATGCHASFDRLVVHARFGTPPYRARYVKRIFEDGSGRPVTLRGTKRIRVVFQNARGHTEGGTDLLPGRADAAVPEPPPGQVGR